MPAQEPAIVAQIGDRPHNLVKDHFNLLFAKR